MPDLRRAGQRPEAQDDHTAPLDAFAHFTEASSRTTDALTLATLARNVLRTVQGDVQVTYYEQQEHRWQGRVFTEGLDEALMHTGGVAGDTPGFREPFERRQVVFFEPWDALCGSAEHTGRAVALYPFLQRGRPNALLAMAAVGRTSWTERERAVFRAVGRSLEFAFERAEQQADMEARTRQLADQTAALNVFTAFTELVAVETDVFSVSRKAYEVMDAHFAEHSSAYYEVRLGLWTALTWTENLTAEQVRMIRAGLPLDVPSFAQALLTKQPVFIDGWDATRERIENTDVFGPVCIYPLLVGEEVRGLFTVGLRVGEQWQARDHGLMRALGRSLTLALERTEQARRLEQERAAVESRNRALVAFEDLSRELTLETDPYVLVKRAQEIVLNWLPGGVATYYELEGTVFRLRTQTGSLRDARLQQTLDAGLPYASARNLQVPFETRQAYYQAQYDPDSDDLANLASHVMSSATLPVIVNGEVQGIFGIGLFGRQRRWSEVDRALLETAARSLSLALERAQSVARQEAKNAEVEARNKVLSAFEDWTRDLAVSANPSVLIQRAQAQLYDLLPIQAAVYYEREEDRWTVKSMLGEYGSDGLQRAHEQGLMHDQTGNLRVPFETGEVLYLAPYDLSTDGLAEHMTHVSATAMLPLRVGGRVQGVLGVARFEGAEWTATDRAVIETVGRSLELALDRASKAAQLEEERAKLTAQTAALATANEELEAFAYSVSHDLRTPVRHIAGFNDLLRKSFGDALDPKAARYLGVVDEAAQRMNALIDAMLNLSRTSRLPLRIGPVDLGALVWQVRQEFEPDLVARQVQWDIQPLPRVMGDQDTLRQVIQNLLSNALKYTHTRDVAVIRVWAEEREGETAVFVQDNGVGFDARYADKLFGVFQRLHRQDEFEGVGVGLANVRRIVQRHGGVVTAHSQVDEGATFGFTLPVLR
ncbi:ATP-binding protein [Deinococcus hohokamensis]|uniref:histidine kinase n=1 Tax=Deinococcus hohokamensis TaxID=309883 RepID=A0ABV9I7G7_9DEIO